MLLVRSVYLNVISRGCNSYNNSQAQMRKILNLVRGQLLENWENKPQAGTRAVGEVGNLHLRLEIQLLAN